MLKNKSVRSQNLVHESPRRVKFDVSVITHLHREWKIRRDIRSSNEFFLIQMSETLNFMETPLSLKISSRKFFS